MQSLIIRRSAVAAARPVASRPAAFLLTASRQLSTSSRTLEAAPKRDNATDSAKRGAKNVGRAALPKP